MVSTANKEPKQKKGSVVGHFLQPYILGLMARLTDVVNDSVASQPEVTEQRRCIRALDEMIQVCGPYARIARPQVCMMILNSMHGLTFTTDLGLPAVGCDSEKPPRSRLRMLGCDAHSLR